MLKPVTVLMMMSFLFSLPVYASLTKTAPEGYGRVNMQGSINDSACNIDFDSREQTISMGVIPLSDIVRDGHGRETYFTINLIDCIVFRPGKDNWKQFSVVFDGDKEGKYFAVHGEASGIALQIIDKYGNSAEPGKLLPLADITPGNNKLNYEMRLVANSHALKSGNYFSSIRFKIDYF